MLYLDKISEELGSGAKNGDKRVWNLNIDIDDELFIQELKEEAASIDKGRKLGGSFAGNQAKTPLIETNKVGSISEGLRHKFGFKRMHTTKVGSFATIEHRLSALQKEFNSLEKSHCKKSCQVPFSNRKLLKDSINYGEDENLVPVQNLHY